MKTHFMRHSDYIISSYTMKYKTNNLMLIITALIASKVIDFHDLKPLDITIIILWFIDLIITLKEQLK